MTDPTHAIPAFVAIEPLQQHIAQLEREVAELKRRAPAQPGILERLERLVRRSGVAV